MPFLRVDYCSYCPCDREARKNCASKNVWCVRWLRGTGLRQTPRKVKSIEEDTRCPLTDNQKHVLRLLSGGMGAREIAKYQGITHWSVNTMLRVIRKKLEVDCNHDAVQKWLSLEKAR